MTAPPLLYLHGGGNVPSRAHALLAEQFQLHTLERPDEGSVRAFTNGAPYNLWASSACTDLALATAANTAESVQTLVLEAPEPPSTGEAEAALSNISVPTLIVFGTRDGVIPAETGRVYREKMPNCNYVLLFDAGHEAAVERPEAFVSLVRDFLTRREAFVVSQRSSILHP